MKNIKRTGLIVTLSLIGAAWAYADKGNISVNFEWIDRTVKPGDNFFDYTNGNWAKKAEIPADRASFGTSTIVANRVEKQVADLVRLAGTNSGTEKNVDGSVAQKISDYYRSFMDEAGIEAKGATPLQKGLAEIAAISDGKGLSAALGATLRGDVDALNNTRFHTPNFLGLWVAADLSQPKKYAAILMQGGLSLPERTYYLSDSPKMKQAQSQLKAHLAKVLTSVGIVNATEKAEKVYQLEQALAKGHWSFEDCQDVTKVNNHWPQNQFESKAPGMDWAAFFEASGLSNQKEFIVWEPSALIAESALVGSEPLETWKDFLTAHYVDQYAGYLSKAFVDEWFDFYGKALSGTPELSPRWKRAVAATNQAMGEAVGKLYVAKYFSPEDKKAVQELVATLVKAFHKRIDALDWMSAETKKNAHAKLDALIVSVGYPDKWRSYEDLKVDPDDAFGNEQRAELFDYRDKLAKLGRPVDRHEWVMNPQRYNAVNLPVLIALNFPAAMLQSPLFDRNAPASMNYGAIGAVIGHEISHTFDSQGALFNAEGEMKNWWTPADFEHFKQASEQLVKQFDAYKPFPDLAVNGKQTLGENIADLGGLAAAFDGYQESLHGAEAPVVDGFTGDQQFYIAYGQMWAEKRREASLRRVVASNEHAPSEYRVETVRNLDPWYKAFDAKPGEKLYLSPSERVRIW